MNHSVEPGFLFPELGGFRHSDVMFVSANGARCVTEFPRKLAFAGR